MSHLKIKVSKVLSVQHKCGEQADASPAAQIWIVPVLEKELTAQGVDGHIRLCVVLPVGEPGS